MKKLLAITVCSLPLALASHVFAQSTATPLTPSASVSSSTSAPSTIRGLSVKDNVLGKSVYNEQDEKIGDIRDIVIEPNGTASHYIVGVGGFLGIGEHDVALPFAQIQSANERYMLRGYTKERLQELPNIELKK